INNYCSGTVALVKSGRTTPDTLLPVLEKTAQQAVRAGMIIKRIREFVKRSEPKRQAARVSDIVADAVGLAEIEARKRRIRIATEIRSRMPIIYVDPVLIEQVLVNLLKNAAEAMHEARPHAVDAVIRVVVRVDAGFVCVSVVDQGPGVDEATIERLFEPFYSTKSDGMGIGLNICRSIIESHRGRLWVVNNIDESGHITGATFHCSLPIGEPADPGNGGSEAPKPQTVTGEL
ncbi:MAG TPA: ATP-binding protein, partial [Trinickia sp.]|nr:ATP-binding protein [Trinickia sp.]